MTEQWQELKETITEMRDNDGTGTQQDVCKFLADYMEVLEKQMQEPCEDWCDVPSNEMTLEQARQAVKDLRKKLAEHLDKEPCEDCISRQKALDCFEQTNTRQGAKYAIETLPSVTPQKPKGKWKRIAGFEDCNYDKCSVCGVYQIFYYGKPSTNYCPNCGAEMSGGGEK